MNKSIDYFPNSSDPLMTRSQRLDRLAAFASLSQKMMMADYKRGWASQLVEVDNAVRLVANLPRYEIDDSPATMYI